MDRKGTGCVGRNLWQGCGGLRRRVAGIHGRGRGSRQAVTVGGQHPIRENESRTRQRGRLALDLGDSRREANELSGHVAHPLGDVGHHLGELLEALGRGGC